MLGLASCLLTACGDSGDGDSGDEPGGGLSNVAARVSEQVTTVVTVTWTTPEASRGYVEYGTTSALGQRTPLEEAASSEHSQLLLGLTADTVIYYRVVAGDGADAARSETKSVRTGYLPVGMPVIAVVGDGHDQFVTTTTIGANAWILVLNPEGQVVWYWTDQRGLQFIRARLSHDKKSVLYNAARASGEPAENSELVRVSIDGSQSSGVPVPYLAHDFVELPDGTLAAIVVDYQTVDGAEIKSNAIVEVSPSGTVSEVWNALDCFDPAEHQSSEPEQGWTLANALDHDETDDVYYFGSRGLSSIARVNRQTRACDWVLGASGSTLSFASGSAQFLHQHQFQVFGDHLLVHDNDGATEAESRVVEYQLDLAAGTATEVWSFTSTPPVYTPVLGEAVRLPGGDTFIDWSIAGQLERVTPTGETTWKLNTRVGSPFGYATLEASLYP